MGKKDIINKASLKVQIASTFIIIIILSIIATLVTLGSYVFIMYNPQKPLLRPDNYYEKQVPKIQDFIVSKGEAILNDKYKVELEKLISNEGIKYQITDLEGNILYGNTKKRILKDKKQLMLSINQLNSYSNNKNSNFGADVEKFMPILNSKGDIKGAVVIEYSIKPSISAQEYRNFIVCFQTFLLLSPFIYIIIFTFIFIKLLIKRIQHPINEIIYASNRIKEKDLDFEINYKSDNELGKLAASFEDMKNALKESLQNQWIMEEDRKEMIKAIAHDLKTPITVIQGHVDVLIEGSKDNPARLEKYLKTIKSNTQRMGKLITDMNRASEIERVDFKLTPTKVNIIEFLENKAEDYKFLCREKNIKFYLDIEDNKEVKEDINIDVQSLEQILDNLISNAIRYTPKEKNIGIKVVIDYNCINFIIEDEGSGFSDKDIPYIFQKFYRGDASRSKEKGHSGLGMYIVKSLVEKHNGWILAENRKETGARIKFIIKEI